MKRSLILPATLAIAAFLTPSLLAGGSGQGPAHKEAGIDPAALQAVKNQLEALNEAG